MEVDMSLLAVALLMFADPVDIDLNDPRCLELDLVVIVDGVEIVAQQLTCRTVDGTYVVIAIKYPELLNCPLGLPCGETIWNPENFYDVELLEDFLRERYSNYYIGLRSPTNVSEN